MPVPDSDAISLDSEQYGLFSRPSPHGPLFPPQTQFSPRKMLWHDGMTPLAATQIVTITTLSHSSSQILSSPHTTLPLLRPLEVIPLTLPRDLSLLLHWLAHSRLILGMNLLYDLSILLYLFRSLSKYILYPHSHTLLDLSIFNYLENELRPERSLKNLGPVLGTHSYEDLHTQDSNAPRYPYPTPQAYHYCAQDSWNVVTDIATLSRLILSRYGPDTPKLSTYLLTHFSDLIWSCIRMSSSGIPLSPSRLLRLHSHLLRRTRRISDTLALSTRIRSGPNGPPQPPPTNNPTGENPSDNPSPLPPPTVTDLDSILDGTPSFPPLPTLLLSGKGSQKSKEAYLSALIPYLPSQYLPQLELTDKQKKLSINDANRSLLKRHLPPTHPAHEPLRMWSSFSYMSKLLSSYTTPLLFHNSNHPDRVSSTILPPPALDHTFPGGTPSFSRKKRLDLLHSTTPKSPSWLAHPQWYVTPSPFKDGQGSSGGTLQIRITCKHPDGQTWPPPIKHCMSSRYGSEGIIASQDASQIELRVAGLLSGEPSIVTAYQENRDLHTERAVEVFTLSHIFRKYPLLESEPNLKRWKDLSPAFDSFERAAGKMCNFADLFLVSAPSLQIQLSEATNTDIPLSLCERIVADRPRVRPILTQWQDTQLALARSRGYAEVPLLGITRTFVDPSSALNEIVNFPIQAFASFFMNRLQIYLSRHLPPTIHIFLNVYDALYFDLRRRDLPLLKEIWASALAHETSPTGIWGLMETHTNNRVPIKTDLSLK